MHINKISIEVTRRCSLRCEHCLRGDMQLVNIDHYYLDSFFSQVDSIGYICFSGGEPSLNWRAIRHSYELIRKYKIPVSYFGIVTNGIGLKPEFIDVCSALYNHCDIKSSCSLQVSNDHFHTKQMMYDDSNLKHLPFYHKRHLVDGYELKSNQVHHEGNGVNILGSAAWSKSVNRYSNHVFSYGILYLNALGEIITGCDWSYENQSKHKVCNVDELSHIYKQRQIV